ncbi:CRISPR-associated helicase Cas3' [Embleya sp. NPDC050493]|uniref:CRISPR-associated helicase Cas3' n=1 Tax=Embleya sp. NPDC050493 TaxID=3363989 RepID=UPI00378D8C23
MCEIREERGPPVGLSRNSFPHLWCWGKTDYRNLVVGPGPRWDPLLAHCLNTAAVCGRLFDTYLSDAVRDRLIAAFGGGDRDTARRVLMLLAALHDMPGKAFPGFQKLFLDPRNERLLGAAREWENRARETGLPLPPDLAAESSPRHELLTAHYLPTLLGCRCGDCDPHNEGPSRRGLHVVAALLGGHHGDIPDASTIADASARHAAEWDGVHRALLADLTRILDVDVADLQELVRPERPCVIPLFAGLVVLSDWLASDESRFAYRSVTAPVEQWWDHARRDAATAVRELRFDAWRPRPARWHDLFPKTAPRPAQQTLIDLVGEPSGPLLAFIEGDTGSGKTEAAWWLAHALALVCGHHGIYTALPTRAAAEQIARRKADYLTRALGDGVEANLAVVHGTAALSAVADELQRAAAGPAALVDSVNTTGCHRTGAVLNGWFLGEKRGLLSPFGVGTVDQIVLAPQRSRHWFLRMFGLANKVVVIDEAHAYELYQQRLLHDAVAWLADAGASVIVLSATLPAPVREAITTAWCAGHRSPARAAAGTSDDQAPITLVDENGLIRRATPPAVPVLHTDIRLVRDPGADDLARNLLREGTAGGIIAVVRNRVASAVELHAALLDQAESAGWKATEIVLLHGRAIDRNRLPVQEALLAKLGKHPDREHRHTRANPARPARLIVVATQVLEQSVDVDVDLLYTDLAPIDLLLQRRGRVHRHRLNDPNRPAHLRRTPLMRVLWTADAKGLPAVEPPASADGFVYAPYVLAVTWRILRGIQRRTTRTRASNGTIRHHHVPRISTPHDTPRFLAAVYGTRTAPPTGELGVLLARTWDDWQRALGEELRQAAPRSRAPYTARGTAIGIDDLPMGRSRTDADDPKSPDYLTARSRLGTPSIEAVLLYEQTSGALTYDPAGEEPVDLRRHNPRTHPARYKLQQREFLRNTIRIPGHWAPKARREGSPKPWPESGGNALRDRPILKFTPDGICVSPKAEFLRHDPVAGLSRVLPKRRTG